MLFSMLHVKDNMGTSSNKSCILWKCGKTAGIVLLCVGLSMLMVYFELGSGWFTGSRVLVREHPKKEVLILDPKNESDRVKVKDLLQEISKNYTDKKFEAMMSAIKNTNDSTMDNRAMISDLKKENAGLKEKNLNLQLNLTSLQNSQISAIKNTNDSITNIRAMISNLKKEITGLKEKNTNLQLNLTSLQNKMKNMTEEHEQFSSTATDLQDLLAKQSETFDKTIENMQKTQQAERKKLQDQMRSGDENIRREFNPKIAHLQNKANENEWLWSKVEKLETNQDTLKSQVSSLEQSASSSAARSSWNTVLLVLCSLVYAILF